MYMVCYAEARPDGKWHKIGPMFQSAIDDGNGLITDRVCDEKNNFLFELLGCIKNSGNHTKLAPIVDIRGLPEDCSTLIRNNKYFLGGYISYATLSELDSYDWEQNVSKLGIINEHQYVRWRKDGKMPVRLHKYVPKNGAVIVEPLLMDKILDEEIDRSEENIKYFVWFEYDKRRCKDLCKFFYNIVLAELHQLVLDDMTPDDVRIVYTFVD